MAIYRGPGGPGDATNDATNQSILAASSAVAAAASEASAAASAVSAANSAALAQTFEPANFATAAQGALADSAIQPENLATVATSGSYTDLINKPALGSAAYVAISTLATAAQGTKADSALQPSAIGSTVQGYDSDLATLASGNVGNQLVSYGQYGVGFKNRIINGAMMIDQRNAGASVTPTNGTYTVDRWLAGVDQPSKFSVQQSTTAPAGFINSMLCTSLSAYTLGTNEAFQMRQNIEGLNLSDLAWGTASAATVTLSFWVRSSLTGTFGGSVNNNAYDRSYVFSYTINSANTWEYKTVTIAGDQTGTWLTTNGVGIRLGFSLGAASGKSTTAGSWGAGFYAQPTGSVAVVGTNGATFYITGVQLEKGSTDTSFDCRPYGTELALCQRYYEFIRGTAFATVSPMRAIIFPKVTKRASPTISTVFDTGSGASFAIIGGGGDTAYYQTAVHSIESGAGLTSSAEL